MALSDNLIAYWKFDESSGDAADSAGSNTGTITGVTYAAGKLNNSAVFDGSASINCGRMQSLEGASALTIAGWWKQTTIDVSQAFFVKDDLGGATSANFGMFSYTNGFLYLEPSASTNRGYIDYSAYMSAGTWTHIAFVFNGAGTDNSGRLKVYFNGIERTLTYAGTIEATAGNDTGNFILGMRGSGSFKFSGSMDDIGVWTRALTGTEISSLYNSGAGLQYPFGEGGSGPANVKTWNGLAKASVKTVNGVAMASNKSHNGVV